MVFFNFFLQLLIEDTVSSEDPDKTPHSDLGWQDARLIWVKFTGEVCKQKTNKSVDSTKLF